MKSKVPGTSSRPQFSHVPDGSRVAHVDANLAFKALAAGRGDLRERLGGSAELRFFAPRYLFVELFDHKEALAKAAKVPPEALIEALHALVTRLDFVNEANIPLTT